MSLIQFRCITTNSPAQFKVGNVYTITGHAYDSEGWVDADDGAEYTMQRGCKGVYRTNFRGCNNASEPAAMFEKITHIA